MSVLRDNKYPVTLFSLIALSFVYNRYFFGVEGQGIKLAFLHASLNPHLFVQDYAMQIKDAYLSCLPYLTRLFKVFMGAEKSYALTYYLFQMIFFIAVYLVSYQVTKKRMIAIFAVTLLIVPKFAPGGIKTFDLFMSDQNVAMSLILVGLYMMVLDRHGWAGGILGLAGSVHFPSLVNVLFLVLTYYIANEWHEKRPRLFLKLRALFVWMLVGIAPFFERVFSFDSAFLKGSMDAEWLQIIAMQSMPWLSVGAGELGMMFLQAFSLLGILMMLKMHRHEDEKILFQFYLSACVALTIGVGSAVLFSRYLPLKVFYLLDGTLTLRLFFIINMIAIAAIIYVVCGRSRFLASFMVVCLMCLKPFAQFWFVLGMFIVLLLVTRLRFLEKIVRRLGFLEPTVNLSGIGHVFFLLGLSCVLLTSLGYGEHVKNPFKKDRNYEYKIQKWLSNHTLIGDTIIVPPYEEDFRLNSKRSIVFSLSDLSLAGLSRDFAFKSLERAEPLCGIKAGDCLGKVCFDQCAQHYGSLRTDKVRDIAARYGARYIVMPVQNPLRLPELYSNRKYTVYQISEYASHS